MSRIADMTIREIWAQVTSPWRALPELQTAVSDIAGTVDTINGKVDDMAAREDQAYETLNATIQTVKDGWASLIAENAHLRELLAQAPAEQAAAVQAALDADSEVDAAKVEAADAALAELVAPAPAEEEPVEEPPAG